MSNGIANIGNTLCTNWGVGNKWISDKVSEYPDESAYTEGAIAITTVVIKATTAFIGNWMTGVTILGMIGAPQISNVGHQLFCGDSQSQSLSDKSITQLNDFQLSVPGRVGTALLNGASWSASAIGNGFSSGYEVVTGALSDGSSWVQKQWNCKIFSQCLEESKILNEAPEETKVSDKDTHDL